MNRYKADLVRLMSFKDGISYGSDHTFTTEALLKITPSDVCRWMNKRAYGDFDPTDDMKPVRRWRTRKAVVDVYIDKTQPYPDACAAAVLSGPAGPCFYKLKQEIQCVEPSLLLNDVAPTVKVMMGESIAKTLALPLLWAALESTDNICDLLPSALQQRIIEAYKKTGGNSELNPVDREALYVLGDGSKLNLVVINEGEVVEMNETRSSLTATVSGGGGEGARREFAALHSQLLTSRRYMTELMNEVLHSRRESQREMEKVVAILRRVAACPIPRVQTGNSSYHTQGDGDLDGAEYRPTLTARLSKRPKDLYELWYEHQFGLAGLKAAKAFTPTERGANKFAYSRRKHFWRVVTNLVQAGYTSDTAIDRVCTTYGRSLSVSNIIAGLREDHKRGGHPNLRV
ncbi:hypothetical protein L917_17198 [Phytophthora nicotianae]|uniref:Uncharacterized protein n=1 Tax=Phytophthora nicotianae TaxID=4792 RepID=W2KC68_PHYNI|nr:hypothetical protein L917_17198 [Phytophthora nicotianae]